jgi:hypothetical protein
MLYRAKGKATLQQPANGFSDTRLEALFALPHKHARKLSRGVIVGVTVATVFGVGVVAFLTIVLIRRRPQKQHQHLLIQSPRSDRFSSSKEKEGSMFNEIMTGPEKAELPGQLDPKELQEKQELHELPTVMSVN